MILETFREEITHGGLHVWPKVKEVDKLEECFQLVGSGYFMRSIRRKLEGYVAVIEELPGKPATQYVHRYCLELISKLPKDNE